MQYVWLIWNLNIDCDMACHLRVSWLQGQERNVDRKLVDISLGFDRASFSCQRIGPLHLCSIWLCGRDLILRVWFFPFGIGGIAVILYERIFRSRHIAVFAKEHHSASAQISSLGALIRADSSCRATHRDEPESFAFRHNRYGHRRS